MDKKEIRISEGIYYSQNQNERRSLEDMSSLLMEKVNSVHHLLRSNEELEEALQEEYDPDFASALEENKVVVAKEKAKIIELKLEIFKEYKINISVPEFVEDCSTGLFI